MPHILVVDDRPLNRHFLTTLLNYYGYEVREAADGAEALNAARERKPDLIIADVAMPTMDGPALARAVRADPVLAVVPIVFYSASYQQVEAQTLARSCGVDYVITKPADPEVVLDVVRRAVGPGKEPARRRPSSDPSEIVARLQLATSRMSALIELMVHLSSERDPDELLRTACLATRKIFGADYAVLRTDSQTHADGKVDTERLEPIQTAVTSTAALRGSGATDPLVAAVRQAIPSAWSALLVPMQSRGNSYGWLLLANDRDAPPFSNDDESIAFAAAAQIRAEHESLRAQTAERQRIEMELDTLVEAAPVPIIAYDRNRMVRVWNPAAERTFGWSAAEVIGGPNPAVPDNLVAAFDQMVAECWAGKTINHLAQPRKRKDGAMVNVNLLMLPLREPGGQPRGCITVLTDVTALLSSREQLRALSARLLSVQEEERTRLARELHDDVGQLLTALKIDASKLLSDLARGTTPPQRVVDGLLPLIDSTMDTVVRLVSELRPSRIGEMGLASAISRKLNEFQQRTEIQVEQSIQPATLDVPDAVAIAAFRILEEGLSNIARHSGATHVKVDVTQKQDSLRLVLQDNGTGISEAARTAPDAYGLIGMKERAVVLGGSVEISSSKRGTTVTARIPIAEDPGLHRR